jgi:hypothetical protein
MITKVTKVVLTFYHVSNPSYEINKFAGQKIIKHIKPYQTAWKHLHNLQYHLVLLARILTKLDLAFLEHHKIS